jgi:hypothetical protein
MMRSPESRPFFALLFAGFALCASSPPLRAQTSSPPDYTAIDRHALSAPASVQTSFRSLGEWLAGPCRSDEEKARALFRWITQNISYDVNALLAGGPISGNAEDALQSKKGVCEGYAGLFMELANAAGLKAAKISGFAKGYGYSAGHPLDRTPNHSWNAVSIDGHWKLLDCTWGAGYIGDDRKFHRAFEPHFFFTPPEEFIYDHLPEKPGWQLLDPPRSRRDYEQSVYVKPGFFDMGLTVNENMAGTLHANGEIVLRLGSTRPVAGVIALFKGARAADERYAFVQNELNSLVLRVTPPDTGEHLLRVFAKSPADTGMYAWIMDYRIQSSQRAGIFPVYPRKYSAFDARNAWLLEPMSGLLDGGSVQHFRLKIPRAEQAAVVVNDDWSFLGRDGEELTGDVTIRPGSISVCAKYPGERDWETLLDFKGK